MLLTAAEPRGTPSHPVKKEPAEPECLTPAHADIQLLPQQAGMASILATAVINSEYAIVPPGLHDSARTTPWTSGYTKIGDHWGLSRGEGCAATAEHGGTGQVPGYPGRVPTSWTGSQAQLRSRAGFLAAAAWTCPGWDAEQQPGSRPTDAAATSTPAPTSGQNCPMRIAGVEGLPLAPCHNAH